MLAWVDFNMLILFSQIPHAITPEDEAPPDPRPGPENKRTWAGIVPDMAELVGRGFREALRRDPDRQKTWVVLIDGRPDQIRAVEKSAAKHKVRVSVACLVLSKAILSKATGRRALPVLPTAGPPPVSYNLHLFQSRSAAFPGFRRSLSTISLSFKAPP